METKDWAVWDMGQITHCITCKEADKAREICTHSAEIHGLYVKEVNRYALFCGYTQKVEIEEKRLSLELWREHDHYHVRFCNLETREEGWRIWETVTTLKEARKIFKKLVKHMKDVDKLTLNQVQL